MIYTVTLNPALDYIVQVDELNIGEVNRTRKEEIVPGGKGINVSSVLKQLGHESIALGFVAGFTGNQLIRELKEREIRSDFISVEGGMTRINVKVKGSCETEINGIGPSVSPVALQVLLIQMERLKEGDVLILSGSIPQSMPVDVYERLMLRLKDRNVRIVVDATGDVLLQTLKHEPFLIKPNHHELGELFGVMIKTKEEIRTYAEKLQAMGAKNILVSMAEKGAALLTQNGEYYMCDALSGKVVNSVGAGDSMVAGFLAAWLETQDFEYAFHMGIAAGSASAFSEYLADGRDILELYQRNFVK